MNGGRVVADGATGELTGEPGVPGIVRFVGSSGMAGAVCGHGATTRSCVSCGRQGVGRRMGVRRLIHCRTPAFE